MNVIFFDIDGVLVRECGVAEFGYAFTLQYIDDSNIDIQEKLSKLQVDNKYIRMIEDIRMCIKGKHPQEKIIAMKQFLNISNDDLNVTDCIKIWYDAQKRYTSQNWPPSKYRIPHVIEMFELLNGLKQEYKFQIIAVTANEHQHAHWLLEYIGVYEYFEDIIGFQNKSDKDQPKNKAEMLKQYLQNKIFINKCMVGDGPTDMIAGKHNDCQCIGIEAQTPADILIKNGALIVFKYEEYEDLIQKLVQFIKQ